MSEPPPLLQPLPDPALELHLNAKPRTHSMLGTHTHEEKKYMMFEDLQWGFPKETSTMMDVKIGFQTHRADHKDANKPKASYYQKATTGTKSLAPLVTQEEVEAEAMTKSRYMHISNMNSSTRTHGFRIDGCR